MVSQELGSDIGQNPIPGSLQINLLFTIYAEQAQTLIASCKLGFSSEDIIAVSLDTNRFGGAERDRTADPLLAKQVLSQLSYSPIQVSIPDRFCHSIVGMVGPGRLELPTSRLSGVRSNHLSYGPISKSPDNRKAQAPSIIQAQDMPCS